MQSVGIICEYNPFHNGHAYQLEAIRRECPNATIVAVMSEHFTQRGEIAIADGYVRAECALRAGVDLVLGLPFPYSCASAEYFAGAGIAILNAMGVDAVHFGSESGDLSLLERASARLYDDHFIEQLTKFQADHPAKGVLRGRQLIYEQLFGEPLPSGSNDLLAMAYLNAIRSQKSNMRPMTVRRLGQGYNDISLPVESVLPSASALRTLWADHSLDALAPHLPAPVFDTLYREQSNGLAPTASKRLEDAILTQFRLSDPDELAQYAEMKDGLAAHLCRAAKEASDYDCFWSAAVTKRYTDARLRRCMLYALCRVPKDMLDEPPAYTRLLSANEKGRALLAATRKSRVLPVLTKPSDLPLDVKSQRQRAVEERAEALFSLSLPTPRPSGFLMQRSPYITK